MTTPHTAAPLGVERTAPDLAAIEARAAAAAHAAREYRYCRDCGAVDSSGRAGWMCRTCGTILPSDCPDAKATAIAAKVARDLGCADLDDVPDALKRVLADNADAEIHRRVLTEQSDAQRTRAEAAEEALTTAREERDAARAEAAGLRAVVEGRTVPPTPQEIAAHHDASGSGWLVSSDRDVIPYTLCRSEARDGGAPDGARWWPLDASGRPCDWPTVDAEAATGAALAGEGR